MIKFVLVTAAAVLSSWAFIAQAEQLNSDDYVIPATKKVVPEYPTIAHRKGVSGYVLVSYDVDAKGRATNVTVESEEPKRIFSKAAMRALKKSKFDTAAVDASSVKRQQKLYVFDVNQAQSTRLASRN